MSLEISPSLQEHMSGGKRTFTLQEHVAGADQTRRVLNRQQRLPAKVSYQSCAKLAYAELDITGGLVAEERGMRVARGGPYGRAQEVDAGMCSRVCSPLFDTALRVNHRLTH